MVIFGSIDLLCDSFEQSWFVLVLFLLLVGVVCRINFAVNFCSFGVFDIHNSCHYYVYVIVWWYPSYFLDVIFVNCIVIYHLVAINIVIVSGVGVGIKYTIHLFILNG